MDPLDYERLKTIFKLNHLKKLQEESDEVEYKLSFDWDGKGNTKNRARYAKTMAAFANNKGGYLVFGVSDKRVLEGAINFDNIDIGAITQFLNAYFTPQIQFSKTTFPIDDKELGVIYTYPFSRFPIICIQDHKETIQSDTNGIKTQIVLTEGDVYYRYAGVSEKCKPSDLMSLFEKYAEKKGAIEMGSNEQNEQFRKRDIMPLFVYSGGSQSPGNISTILRNIGDRAKIIDIQEYDDNQVNFFATKKNGFIDKGQEWTFQGLAKNRAMSNHDIYYHIDFLFEDRDGRRYKIEMSKKGVAKPEISEPEEVDA